jgi:hypothetical protein
LLPVARCNGIDFAKGVHYDEFDEMHRRMPLKRQGYSAFVNPRKVDTEISSHEGYSFRYFLLRYKYEMELKTWT